VKKCLNCNHQRDYCSSLSLYMSTKGHGGMTLAGKPYNSERNLSQCHLFHHKSRMD
jgi:hypothetical protein